VVTIHLAQAVGVSRCVFYGVVIEIVVFYMNLVPVFRGALSGFQNPGRAQGADSIWHVFVVSVDPHVVFILQLIGLPSQIV